MTSEVKSTELDESTAVAAAEPAEDGRPEASREAAKYRTRLREAEAERDRLASVSTALRDEVLNFHLRDDHEVTTVPTTGNRAMTPEGQVKPVTVSVRLRHPEDFGKHTGLTGDDLTDEAGRFDRERFATVMGDLYAARSDLFVGRSDPVRTIGNTPEVPKRQGGLAAALAHRGSRSR